MIMQQFYHSKIFCYYKYMIKKLSKSGSSYSLTITKTMLEILGIDPKNDFVELRFEGEKLIVTKVKNKQQGNE